MPPSAEAASIGKYIEIPPTTHTGSINVPIQLHTLKANKLSLPISLSYHTGGIKADELATWVGTGFKLNATSLIHRTVKGQRDESAFGYLTNGVNFTLGEFTVFQGAKDSQPDIFSYHLPISGRSGKFIFNENGEPETVPKQDIMIISNEVIGNEISGFTIIDVDGTKYYFGKYGDGNVAWGTSYIDDLNPVIHRTEWHLMRIESYDATSWIDFTYEREEYSTRIPAYRFAFFSNGPSKINDYDIQKVDTRRLKSITTVNNTISFNTTTKREDLRGRGIYQPEELDEVVISDGTYSMTWDFTYDYFESDNVPLEAEDKRLLLRSLQKKATDGSDQENAYTFNYIQNNGTDFLPNRYTKSVDYWGYFNGNPNDNFLINIPKVAVNGINYPIGGADRSTVPSKMMYGALESVTSPTGGSINLTYESNRFKPTMNCPTLPFTNATNQFKDQIESCTNAMGVGNCCGNNSNSMTYNFTTENEITNGSGKFIVRKDLGDSSGNCTNPINPESTIRIVDQATSLVIYSKPIHLGLLINAAMSDPNYPNVVVEDEITIGFQMLNLSINTDYTIEIESEDVYGKFSIFENTLTPDTPEGEFYVGGLRIFGVTYSDPVASTPDITYDYTYSEGTLFEEFPKFAVGVSDIFTLGFPNPIVDCSPLPGTSLPDCFRYVNGAYYFEQSIKPLSNSSGHHIGYSEVTKEISGSAGGKEVLEYHIEFEPLPIPAQADSYPGLHPQYHLAENGTTIRDDKFRNTIPIHLEEHTYNFDDQYQNFNDDNFAFTVISDNDGYGAGFVYPFHHRTRTNLLMRTDKTLDGVLSTVDYKYDSVDFPTMMTESKTTNSDGEVHIQTYSYPDSYIIDEDATIGGQLKSDNILQPAWKSEQYIGSVTDANKIDGVKTLWSDFAGTHYPSEERRYEVTFDSNGNISGTPTWVLQSEYKNYDAVTGRPTKIDVRGWLYDIDLTWNAAGLLEQNKYDILITDYIYHTDSDLLKEKKDINDLVTKYEFDELFRLKGIDDMCTGSKQTYEYIFPMSDLSYVETTFDYPSIGLNTSPNLFKDRQYVDGHSRPLQTVRMNQHPTDPSTQDIVIAKEYDNVGRLNYQYEPTSNSPSNIGDFANPSAWNNTRTTYYSDPLNRPLQVYPPGLNDIRYIYSANSDADMVILDHTVDPPSNSDFYAAKTLYKQTQIDQNLNRTITFTDKLGRVVLVRNQNSNDLSEFIDTYTLYDAKSRVTTVIPPDSKLSNVDLIHTYSYSGDDLVLTKKMPDSEEIVYTYDSRDLLKTYQDGYLRSLANSTKYKYTYDAYGNILTEGLCSGLCTSYTTILKESTFGTSNGIEKNKMLTSKVRLLGTANFIDTKYTYDECGRVESLCSDHMLNQTNVSPIVCPNTYVKTYSYDSMNNITSQDESITRSDGTVYDIFIEYDYDHIGREKRESMTIGSGSTIVLSDIEFTVKDEIKHISLGETLTPNSFLQDVSHQYNARGQLIYLNNFNVPVSDGTGVCQRVAPNNSQSARSSTSPDLFKMNLAYTFPDCNRFGNISVQTWEVLGKDVELYGYEYDYLNRIEHANYGTYSNGTSSPPNMSGEYDVDIEYQDGRGNILSIQREGFQKGNNGYIGGTMDDLNFTYYPDMNRIKKITDGVVGSLQSDGYNPQTTGDYTYDNDSGNGGLGNGNILHDPSRKADFAYNHLNLPSSITLTTGEKVEYTYDANGKVHQRIETDGNGTAGKRNYIGHYEFADDEPDIIHHKHGYFRSKDFCSSVASLYLTIDEPSDKTYRAIDITSKREVDPSDDVEYIGRDWVEMIPDFDVPLGTNFLADIDPPNCTTNTNEWVPHYIIRDHLGNNRVTFADLDESETVDASEIIQESHYYPFGLRHTDPDEYKKGGLDYLYNGKEFQKSFDLNYYNYGARFYDPSIGRFTTVDPLAHILTSYSPYVYTLNNPINMIDVDGRFPFPTFSGYGIIGSKFAEGVKNVSSAIVREIGSSIEALGNLVQSPHFARSAKRNGNSEASIGFTNQAKKSAERIAVDAAIGYGVGKVVGPIIRSVKGLAKVDLMGGRNGTAGYTNYDIQASTGIIDDVSNFRNHFGKGSVGEMIVNNPQAQFLTEISESIASGGTVTVRGTKSNPFFRSIYEGNAEGLSNFRTASTTEGLSNQGFLRTDGTPIGGQNNIIEVVLKKIE